MRVSSFVRRYLTGGPFVLEINDGVTTEFARCKVPGSFIAAVEARVSEYGIRHATVYGIRRGRDITLGFSGEFPENARQPLLNAWHAHKHKFSG